MKLGAFSVSLAVKDLSASKDFYEKLGFTVFGGAMEQNYLIMKNEGTLIGLFQGMFENNILTFNPGWDQDAQTVPGYTDVRKIHQSVADAGLATDQQALEGSDGPGSFVMMDPDGNAILIDQHI
jgi:catechol 2,3-dioxygenase-like lactoylglutathione lyase family enzyme